MGDTLCQQETTINQSKTSDKLTANGLNDSTNDIKNESEKKISNDTTKISGIYKIVNKVNGKYYVGKTKNLDGRWRQHKWSLSKGIHHSYKLQDDYNLYGIECFEFEVIDYVDAAELLSVEQKYLDECSNNVDSNYNVTYSSEIVKMTDEIKKKLSRAAIKRMTDPNMRKRISEKMKGRVVSEETRRKQSLSQLRRKKRLQRESWINGSMTQEHKNKISNSVSGKRKSIEHKNKIRESMIKFHSKVSC